MLIYLMQTKQDYLYKVFTSTLPPDITHTTFSSFCGLYFPDNNAAVVTAPAPSATTFWCSIKNNIPCAISSSDTVITSSTNSFIISKVVFPGVFTAIPSMKVSKENGKVTTAFNGATIADGIAVKLQETLLSK